MYSPRYLGLRTWIEPDPQDAGIQQFEITPKLFGSRATLRPVDYERIYSTVSDWWSVVRVDYIAGIILTAIKELLHK